MGHFSKEYLNPSVKIQFFFKIENYVKIMLLKYQTYIFFQFYISNNVQMLIPVVWRPSPYRPTFHHN